MGHFTKEQERAKKELMTPLLLEAGAALLDCQGFEYGMALFLYQLSRLNLIEGLDTAKMQAIMDDVEKKTAGQLIKMLKEYAAFSEEQETALSDALKARNKMIHRVLIDNSERFADTEERKLLVKEIRQLRKTVNNGDAVLRDINNNLCAALDGFDLDSLKEELASKLFSRAV